MAWGLLVQENVCLKVILGLHNVSQHSVALGTQRFIGSPKISTVVKFLNVCTTAPFGFSLHIDRCPGHGKIHSAFLCNRLLQCNMTVVRASILAVISIGVFAGRSRQGWRGEASWPSPCLKHMLLGQNWRPQPADAHDAGLGCAQDPPSWAQMG